MLSQANRVLNAFESVRPKGVNAQAAAPARHNVGRAPGLLPGSMPRNVALDSNGRPCVPMAPRANVGFVVEDRVQGAASASRRQALVKGGI